MSRALDPPRARPRVVILGGGFAGLNAAKRLRRAEVDVVVVDRCNHHLFQPLLYQVATAGLNAQNVAHPIRKILRRQKNAEVLFAEATGFDLEARRVELGDEALTYDWLVVAVGVRHGYFDHPEWSRHAPGLKTLAEAKAIRARILRAFEEAEREDDAEARQAWLTFVVIGGGPTGVELAGAIAELARHTLPGDFRRVDPRTARVVLVEGDDRVLPSYPPELSARAERALERLGVTVRTKEPAQDIDERGVELAGERLAARTVLWAAGVEAPALLGELGAPQDRSGRVEVEPDLSLPGHREVFVVGDAAAVSTDGDPVPGVAPAAIQMGRHVAACVKRDLAGREREPFRYVDRGSLATIGRASAVAELGRLRLSGPLAWLLWLAVHILFLIGFRTRLLVLFEWAWMYVTYQRSARVFAEAAGADKTTTT